MLEQVVKDTDTTAGLLRQLNGLTSPEGYGFDKGEIRDILRFAKDLRNRYAALQLFYDMGVLDELADHIVEAYL